MESRRFIVHRPFSRRSPSHERFQPACRLIQLALRDDAQHHTATREIFVRHPLHIGRGHRQRLLVIAAEHTGIALVASTVGQPELFSKVRFEAPDERQLLSRHGLLNLLDHHRVLG